MTHHTPGTNAMQPDGGAKPHHGKVVHSTDGKVLTDQEEGEQEPQVHQDKQSE